MFICSKLDDLNGNYVGFVSLEICGADIQYFSSRLQILILYAVELMSVMFDGRQNGIAETSVLAFVKIMLQIAIFNPHINCYKYGYHDIFASILCDLLLCQ